MNGLTRMLYPWAVSSCLTIVVLLFVFGYHSPRSHDPISASTPIATHTSTPTSISIPPATPSSTATPTPTLVPERVRITFYGEAFRGGLLYCGTDIYGRYDPDDPTTVAVGADGPPCGSKLLLCSESACIRAVIKDRCGGCGPGHLDLSRAAWDDLGHPSTVDMTVKED